MFEKVNRTSSYRVVCACIWCVYTWPVFASVNY